MYSVEQIETGIAKYIDVELLPSLPRDGLKGFGVGVAAALMVKRGGNALRELLQNKVLQAMQITSPDGMVDVDVLCDVCKQNIPSTGLPVALPMGLAIRLRAEDVDSIHQYIKEAGQ